MFRSVHDSIIKENIKKKFVFAFLKALWNALAGPGAFDCLVYEMLFVRSLKPNLNVQADSIRAKVFL